MDSISLDDKLSGLKIIKQEVVKENFYKNVECARELKELFNSIATRNDIGILEDSFVLKSELQITITMGNESDSEVQAKLELKVYSFFDGYGKDILDLINR